jgi:peptidyl-prolyl cis-trans isomerase B (cyclophilin B)
VSARLAAIGTATAATLLVAGCGGSSSGKADNPIVAAPSTSAPSSAPASAAAGPCGPAPTAKPKDEQFKAEPPVTVAPVSYTATIVTNCGTIVASLDAKKAPHTVNSFAFLASHHYFDNTPCPRIVTSGIYVLQCGDPKGDGTGGPGYTIPDENLAGATYPTGTLAMANTGQPHTGGSQFFICYADTPLPPQYTPFGHVTKGLDVIKRIAANGDDGSNPAGGGHPRTPVVIESFTVVKG